MTNELELFAPCHFGMEAVLKREIYDLGYDITRTEDGRVYFHGDKEAVARANLWLRTAERVLIHVANFPAGTYDELFEGIKKIDWSAYIPRDGKFWVSKATSINSRLFSPSDIQSIVKKAMVESLRRVYPLVQFPETGAAYPLRISIYKDMVTVGLDTSGQSLHMRGYRKRTAKAPITETLAAALLLLTPWKKDRILVDPFCGSGTFAIEAAMMVASMAPGLYRTFLAESWENLFSGSIWKDAREEAGEELDLSVRPDIQAYDIDESMTRAARQNASDAKVENLIHIQTRDVAALSHPKKYGFIVTNPPYGERLEEKDALSELYRTLGERFRLLDAWSLYLISSLEDTPKYIGRPAEKNRKVYNGMMKTYFYQFPGEKPPKAIKSGGRPQ